MRFEHRTVPGNVGLAVLLDRAHNVESLPSNEKPRNRCHREFKAGYDAIKDCKTTCGHRNQRKIMLRGWFSPGWAPLPGPISKEDFR